MQSVASAGHAPGAPFKISSANKIIEYLVSINYRNIKTNAYLSMYSQLISKPLC